MPSTQAVSTSSSPGCSAITIAPSNERAERERSWTGPIGSPHDRHALLVAERRERVIGFVAVVPTRDADGDPKRTGELATVMVDRDERGRVSALRSWRRVNARCESTAFRYATLWVVPENTRAVHCYERCGWIPDGSDKLMNIGGHEIRAVRYRKPLAPYGTAAPSS